MKLLDLFSGGQEKLLTTRPKGMSYQKYKETRKAQNKAVKSYKEGRMLYQTKVLIPPGNPLDPPMVKTINGPLKYERETDMYGNEVKIVPERKPYLLEL